MILGLDFGTATGVAYGRAGVAPYEVKTETWRLPAGGGDAVGAFMDALHYRLLHRLTFGVDLVVFEAPILMRGHGTNQVRRAFGAAAICERLCHDQRVPVIEVPPLTLKKEFSGDGRTPDLIQAARRRGFTCANDHEADALACWLHAVTHRHREHAFLYDPIFSGAQPV